MKLFLLCQDEVRGYDTYDAMVVAAEDEGQARMIRPVSQYIHRGKIMLNYDPPPWDGKTTDCWGPADLVHVTCIGVAASGIPAGQILVSFNAG